MQISVIYGCRSSRDTRCARVGVTPRCIGRRRALRFARELVFAGQSTEKEVKPNQAAEKAAQQQWDRLRSRTAWGEGHPREWEDVAREARDTKQEVHFGMVFGFVVAKNADLPAGDPRRDI